MVITVFFFSVCVMFFGSYPQPLMISFNFFGEMGHD